MVKVMELNQKQFKEFQKSNRKAEIIKDILSISEDINIGTTVINAENAKPLDVFKNSFKEKETFYIVIEPIGNKLAFAYSIY